MWHHIRRMVTGTLGLLVVFIIVGLLGAAMVKIIDLLRMLIEVENLDQWCGLIAILIGCLITAYCVGVYLEDRMK